MDAVTLALIKSMAGKGGGGGSSLPSVTSADNGKVLAVKDGAWAAQGDVVLTGTYANGVISITTNPLPSEDVIKNAYESGRGVVVRIGNDEAYEIYRATPFSTSNLNSTNTYTFGGIGEDFDGYRRRFYIDFFYSDSDPVVSAFLFQGSKFIVTLTPTSLDLSGTADKTLNEVNTAYEAGMEIVAHVPFNGAVIEAKLVQVIGGTGYLPTFYWMAIEPSQNLQILAYNATNADDPNPTPFDYSTHIYSLTPAS